MDRSAPTTPWPRARGRRQVSALLLSAFYPSPTDKYPSSPPQIPIFFFPPVTTNSSSLFPIANTSSPPSHNHKLSTLQVFDNTSSRPSALNSASSLHKQIPTRRQTSIMSSPASGSSLFGPSPVSGAGAGAGAGPTSAGAGPASTVTPQKATGSATKDGPSSKSFNPTPKDSLFMLTIVMLNKDPVNVDWDKVAEELGFKNAGVAKVCSCLLSLALSSPLHTCHPVWAHVCALSGPVSFHCKPVGLSSGLVGFRPDCSPSVPDQLAFRPDRWVFRPDWWVFRPDRSSFPPDSSSSIPNRPASRPDRSPSRPDTSTSHPQHLCQPPTPKSQH